MTRPPIELAAPLAPDQAMEQAAALAAAMRDAALGGQWEELIDLGTAYVGCVEALQRSGTSLADLGPATQAHLRQTLGHIAQVREAGAARLADLAHERLSAVTAERIEHAYTAV